MNSEKNILVSGQKGRMCCEKTNIRGAFTNFLKRIDVSVIHLYLRGVPQFAQKSVPFRL